MPIAIRDTIPLTSSICDTFKQIKVPLIFYTLKSNLRALFHYKFLCHYLLIINNLNEINTCIQIIYIQLKIRQSGRINQSILGQSFFLVRNFQKPHIPIAIGNATYPDSYRGLKVSQKEKGQHKMTNLFFLIALNDEMMKCDNA